MVEVGAGVGARGAEEREGERAGNSDGKFCSVFRTDSFELADKFDSVYEPTLTVSCNLIMGGMNPFANRHSLLLEMGSCI